MIELAESQKNLAAITKGIKQFETDIFMLDAEARSDIQKIAQLPAVAKILNAQRTGLDGLGYHNFTHITYGMVAAMAFARQALSTPRYQHLLGDNPNLITDIGISYAFHDSALAFKANGKPQYLGHEQRSAELLRLELGDWDPTRVEFMQELIHSTQMQETNNDGLRIWTTAGLNPKDSDPLLIFGKKVMRAADFAHTFAGDDFHLGCLQGLKEEILGQVPNPDAAAEFKRKDHYVMLDQVLWAASNPEFFTADSHTKVLDRLVGRFHHRYFVDAQAAAILITTHGISYRYRQQHGGRTYMFDADAKAVLRGYTRSQQDNILRLLQQAEIVPTHLELINLRDGS